VRPTRRSSRRCTPPWPGSTACGRRPKLDEAFGRSVPYWPAFADTADALRYLQGHYRLVILSNVDRRSFAATQRKLGVEFDAVYTAEDIGSYKPSAANFDYLVRKVREDLDCGPETILHTAQSLHHDHAPARAHGLANAWIDRQGTVAGRRMGRDGQHGRMASGGLPVPFDGRTRRRRAARAYVRFARP
jgi:HAD superfamily hydrolase (TIGR01493 family)